MPALYDGPCLASIRTVRRKSPLGVEGNQAKVIDRYLDGLGYSTVFDRFLNRIHSRRGKILLSTVRADLCRNVFDNVDLVPNNLSEGNPHALQICSANGARFFASLNTHYRLTSWS